MSISCFATLSVFLFTSEVSVLYATEEGKNVVLYTSEDIKNVLLYTSE